MLLSGARLEVYRQSAETRFQSTASFLQNNQNNTQYLKIGQIYFIYGFMFDAGILQLGLEWGLLLRGNGYSM
jgi:hypothetical protein